MGGVLGWGQIHRSHVLRLERRATRMSRHLRSGQHRVHGIENDNTITIRHCFTQHIVKMKDVWQRSCAEEQQPLGST